MILGEALRRGDERAWLAGAGMPAQHQFSSWLSHMPELCVQGLTHSDQGLPPTHLASSPAAGSGRGAWAGPAGGAARLRPCAGRRPGRASGNPLPQARVRSKGGGVSCTHVSAGGRKGVEGQECEESWQCVAAESSRRQMACNQLADCKRGGHGQESAAGSTPDCTKASIEATRAQQGTGRK